VGTRNPFKIYCLKDVFTVWMIFSTLIDTICLLSGASGWVAYKEEIVW